ncbi:response regulator transcription factor [Streptomyces lycii]|uniref:response regulator transcription factor n=1 Tax=Streptomyces lycii TaxID=2654337 RepID=UPI002E25FB9E
MRVIVAEDSVLLREGLVRLLQEAGFTVAGQAGTAEEALSRAARCRPDVALMDIRMPPTHTDEGVRAALALRESLPDTGVLLLSQYVETGNAVRVMAREPRGFGYLLKNRVADIGELTDAVKRVGAGETVVDPEVVARLMGRPRVAGGPDVLTPREREVLALMAEGRSNEAISERLYISAKTTETHVRNVFTKLGLEPCPEDHRRVLAVLAHLQAS